MPRTLPPPLEAGLDFPITEPVYLIEVLLDAPLYWTTSDQVEWNTIVWQPVAARVLQLSESSARIELRNDDNSGSSLVLNNTLRDREFRIYLFYNGEAVELFRGYGSDAQVSAMEVTIDLQVDQASNTAVPKGRLAAPKFTQLPRLGEVIKWGTEFYKVTN